VEEEDEADVVPLAEDEVDVVVEAFVVVVAEPVCLITFLEVGGGGGRPMRDDDFVSSDSFLTKGFETSPFWDDLDTH